MQTTKADMERMFAAAGIRQELRQPYRDYDIYVGEGFSSPPHFPYRRFGIDRDEYPFGCWIEFYWIGKGERLFIGSILHIDAFHNSGIDAATKKKMRLNTAIERARQDIDKLKAVHANAS